MGYQRWQFKRAGGDNTFFITNSHTGKSLEDRDGNVGVHEHQRTNQIWTVTRVPNDGQVHWFLTSHRGKQLEDRDGTVGLHEHRGTYQVWSIMEAEHGACKGWEPPAQRWRPTEVPISCDVLITGKRRSQQLEDRHGTVGLHYDTGAYQRWRFHPFPTADGDNTLFFITNSHTKRNLEDRHGNVGVHMMIVWDLFQSWKVTRVPNDGQVHWFLTSHTGQQLEDRDGTVGLQEHRGAYQIWSIPEAEPGSCQ